VPSMLAIACATDASEAIRLSPVPIPKRTDQLAMRRSTGSWAGLPLQTRSFQLLAESDSAMMP
jgi:hypothetical protein